MEPDDPRLFRVVSGRMFIDESGQFRPHRSGQPPEVGVVAGFALPYTEQDVERLHRLVDNLRRQILGSESANAALKGKMLTEAHYELIGREMQDGWVFGHVSTSYAGPEHESITETLSNLAAAVQSKRGDLAGNRGLDLRLDFLIRQCEAETRAHPVYLMLLFQLYLKTADWFRSQRIIPNLRVWLDDRLARADHEFHGFFGRAAIWTRFPEIYSRRLGESLGIDGSSDFVCRVASDSEEDGLVIADAIAYAAGMVARGQDERGTYQRALDALTVSKDVC